MNNFNRKKFKLYLRQINYITYPGYVNDKSKEANLAAKYWLASKIKFAESLLRKFKRELKVYDRRSLAGLKTFNLPIYVPGKGLYPHHYSYLITQEDVFDILVLLDIREEYIRDIKFMSSSGHYDQKQYVAIGSSHNFFECAKFRAEILYINQSDKDKTVYERVNLGFFVVRDESRTKRIDYEAFGDRAQREEEEQFYRQFL